MFPELDPLTDGERPGLGRQHPANGGSSGVLEAPRGSTHEQGGVRQLHRSDAGYRT